jgi:hypothetical protein
MTDKRIEDYWWEYVFAITEKGSCYKIYTKAEHCGEDSYRVLWECYYGGKRAWYERYYDEKTESDVPFAHIDEHKLVAYWNGECTNDLKMVLDCYDFDSSIKEFYIVSYLCAETLPVGASQLFLIKITKSGRDCIVPTELEDAPMKLFKDLKPLDNKMHHIAGLCVDDAKKHIHLIDWDVTFREFYDVNIPESELFDVSHYKGLTQKYNAYQMTQQDAEHIQAQTLRVYPKAVVLWWEYEDECKFKLKQAPTVCFVDLCDERNLCNGTVEEVLSPSAAQEVPSVEKYEQQTIPGFFDDDILPY